MLKRIYNNTKYLFYLIPVILLVITERLKVIDLNSAFILNSAYVVLVFIFGVLMNMKKVKKSEKLVNLIEEIAKGNLRIDLSIGAGTKRNLDKIQEHLTGLMKNYCVNNYNLGLIKEKQGAMLSKYKEIALFFITDETGQQIYNSLGESLVSNGQREYFKRAKETGKPQISDIVISKITDKLAIVISVPYFQGSEFKGIFAVTIDMQAVSTSEEKLENALLGTVESLKGLIRYIQHSGHQVANSAEALSAISQESAAVSESVAVSSYEVSKNAEEQLNEVLSATAAVQQVAASIQEILENAEKINHLSREANKSALIGEEEVKHAVISMADLEKSSQKMRSSLNEINKSSAKMDGIVRTIHEIAEQTNLLALNASIEAARAGEAGRGFAVVADEVRKLAEDSKKSTMEINSLITEIQSNLTETNRVVNEDSEIVEAGTRTVNHAGEALKDIMNYVEIVNEQVTSVTAAINEVAKGSQDIAASTNIIQQRSSGVSEEIHNVSAAAEEQTAAIQEIASASQDLMGLSRELQETANHFKV